MRITKKEFVTAMAALQVQNEKDVEIAGLLGKAFPNVFEANLLPQNEIIQNGMITLLEELTNDAGGWIKYYMWELDFGKEAYRLKAYNKKKEYILSNAGKLYDFMKL